MPKILRDHWGAILLLILVVLLILMTWLWLGESRRRSVETATARSQAAVATAGSGLAAAASTAVDANHQAALRSETLSRENQNAILNAPGADAPVDPALRDAWLDGLCRRAAYRDHPRCASVRPRDPG
jgi:hypothetical protein